MTKQMEKPKVKFELEFGYGTYYGFEEAAALMQCLKEHAPSCGKKVKQFEDDFAAYCDTKYALALTSATTGLKLAGKAVGIEPDNHTCKLDFDSHRVFRIRCKYRFLRYRSRHVEP
jgi:hypothetical protein